MDKIAILDQGALHDKDIAKLEALGWTVLRKTPNSYMSLSTFAMPAGPLDAVPSRGA